MMTKILMPPPAAAGKEVAASIMTGGCDTEAAQTMEQ